MACNDQLMIIYNTEIIVPGITSCPESLSTCKQLSCIWSRYHSLDDQVIIPQKVGGFHEAAGFTLEHMTKFSMMLTLSFPEPSHRCTTLVTPCPRCHTDQFQKGVDHHAGGGALPNAIIPKLSSFPEPTARHLCNRFPCPLCQPGRTEAEDYRDEIKHHVISEELQNPCPKYQQVRHPSHSVVLDNACCASAEAVLMTFNTIVDPMRTLPDGGHRCLEFPCPKCHGRQSQNAVHAVQSINVSESGSPNLVPEVVKISFPEPTGHRCNRFPCPLCHPGWSSPPVMSTAEVDHDETSKHHAISEELQNPCPKYQQVRGSSQNVVLDNSCCASAGVELMTFNPIVDPMRTLPDGGHRCTQFPCPKCHGRRSQNAVHGVQRINVSESG
jgi:hypothetical protein